MEEEDGAIDLDALLIALDDDITIPEKSSNERDSGEAESLQESTGQPKKPDSGEAESSSTSTGQAKTTPRPQNLVEKIKRAEEGTIASIKIVRNIYEKAFPETFSPEIPENAAKLKAFNNRLQIEIETVKSNVKIISQDRANELYTFFLLSDIIKKSTPCKVELSPAVLDKITKAVKKNITDLRLEFSSSKIDLPPGVSLEALRKSKTAKLYTTVAVLLRALTDIDATRRIEVRHCVESELATLLKFTDNDLNMGFFRNTNSPNIKTVVSEIKYHLEPNSIELADALIKRFKEGYKKVDKSSDHLSMAAQFSKKNNDLFEFLAKAITDFTKILVKQKLPKAVRCIAKDIFLVIDGVAKTNIKDSKKSAEYALHLKRQVLPFIFLNGYGGTITNKFFINLTGNESTCATYIWKLFTSVSNRVGAIASDEDKAKDKDTPKAIVKAVDSAAKDITRYFEILFNEIQANDPDKQN